MKLDPFRRALLSVMGIVFAVFAAAVWWNWYDRNAAAQLELVREQFFEVPPPTKPRTAWAAAARVYQESSDAAKPAPGRVRGSTRGGTGGDAFVSGADLRTLFVSERASSDWTSRESAIVARRAALETDGAKARTTAAQQLAKVTQRSRTEIRAAVHEPPAHDFVQDGAAAVLFAETVLAARDGDAARGAGCFVGACALAGERGLRARLASYPEALLPRLGAGEGDWFTGLTEGLRQLDETSDRGWIEELKLVRVAHLDREYALLDRKPRAPSGPAGWWGDAGGRVAAVWRRLTRPWRQTALSDRYADLAAVQRAGWRSGVPPAEELDRWLAGETDPWAASVRKAARESLLALAKLRAQRAAWLFLCEEHKLGRLPAGGGRADDWRVLRDPGTGRPLRVRRDGDEIVAIADGTEGAVEYRLRCPSAGASPAGRDVSR